MEVGGTCGYCGRGGGLRHDPSQYSLWVSGGKRRGGMANEVERVGERWSMPVSVVNAKSCNMDELDHAILSRIL